MKRTSLYSRSRRGDAREPRAAEVAVAAPSRRARIGPFARRHALALLLGCALLLALGGYALFVPPAQRLTQRDIDAAVLHTLENRPPERSRATSAYEVIRPSVVLVRRLGEDEASVAGASGETQEDGAAPDAARESRQGADGEAESGDTDIAKDPGADARKFSPRGLGTGVVFSEDGMIFTNLHVIAGAEKIGVVFSDGTESDVELLDLQPENDLAVLRALTLPDDLRPATLRTTRGLQTGDEVLAVGFPFGIGPTATWGIVSGLRRQHYSEEGRRNLIDLIQFDAAANPGNSGGPLVTRDGDVVGIVTAIVNPTEEGFFVGIGFAVPIENAAAAAGVSPF
jgi:S1-C subfamily serine protease